MPPATPSTMVRHQLRHMLRNPGVTLFLVLLPVVFLLLFVYLFGATLVDGLHHGLGAPTGGRAVYTDYVSPAIIVLTVASGATATAISVATDMTEGIIDRFRTMPIWRPSVLAGHVLGSMIQTLLAVAVVTGVALVVGFRPSAGAVEWLAAAGVVAMTALALTWLGVAPGVAAKRASTSPATPPRS